MKNSVQSLSETDTVWFHIQYSPVTSHSSVWVGLFTSELFKMDKHNTFMCHQGHKLLQHPDDSQIKESHFRIIISKPHNCTYVYSQIRPPGVEQISYFDIYLLTRWGLNHTTKLQVHNMVSPLSNELDIDR
jgi:hypothetical protein